MLQLLTYSGSLVTLVLADMSVDVTSIDFSPFTEPVFLVRLLYLSGFIVLACTVLLKLRTS